MNRVDQNINKDMNDSSLIDLASLNFSDNQTWLYKIPNDSGKPVDLVDWSLSLDWPVYDDDEYKENESKLYAILDEILKNQVVVLPDKHKFDSRTYVKPKRRSVRPSIHTIQSVAETSPPSLSPNNSLSRPNNYMTYNKYSSSGLGPILRHKTFNVDTDTENSTAIKEYAMKRKSIVQDEQQVEDDDASERLSSEPARTKPISIDFSQPAHNLHNTFNKGLSFMTDRGSLNMFQSGESLMRMSPPSLVSSLLMDGSGTFNPESLEGRRSTSHRDSGLPTSNRESIDPMITSMTLSILDVKDMSTSFLSQTTHPDHDSLMDSLPPSLVSSVNSSFVVSNASKPRSDNDSNSVFSSATFTHLEQSERLLSSRPRHQLYNSFKRDSLRNSEWNTKSREEAIDTKVLNENGAKSNDMTETVTLHYSNRQFKKDADAEKENLSASFEKDDAFFKDNGMQKLDTAKNSLNITLDKQELNEIIQARQKLSLARKALPSETEKPLPNQVESSYGKLSNTTITMPRKCIDNASELLSRRRVNGYERTEERQPPQRNATFKKMPSPKNSMDETIVFTKDSDSDTKIIDINSATMNLIDSSERTLQQEEWGSQERAMVASSESTDTATFSSSSPPESVPDSHNPRLQIASTPVTTVTRKSAKNDLMNLHSTISPIFSPIEDQSYIVTKGPSTISAAFDSHNNTTINSATIVRKSAKRDVLVVNSSPEKKVVPKLPTRVPASETQMAPPTNFPRKTGLPTSKLRQYSSHKELRIPANAPPSYFRAPSSSRPMIKRSVFASNPALGPSQPVRRDSYTIATYKVEEKQTAPVLTNPPVLVRQGTETLRRERPMSQLVQPNNNPPTTRPYFIAGSSQSQHRGGRPSTVPAQKTQGPVVEQTRPFTGGTGEPRVSALPRPSRLPAPRRGLRPPSVYTAAPSSDDHY